MKRGIWHKRIPTLFALFILFGSIWVTLFLIQTGVIFVGRASPDRIPQNIKSSNITDTSFTVSFTTNDKTAAALSVEDGKTSPYIVFDDRNKKSGKQTEFYSHYITVADLKPETEYQFSIISSGETFLDGERKFLVRTGPRIDLPPPPQKPIVGRVIMPDASPAQDTIIELDVEGGQAISSLTKDSGDYIVPMNSVRTKVLDGYLSVDPAQSLTITFRRQNLKSTIKSLFKDAESLPVVTLKYEYDFTKKAEEEASTPSSELKAPTPQVKVGEVRILTPRAGESFVDEKPLFRGTALPNQTVKITIQSEIIKTEVKADVNGVWSFRSDSALPPGQHKITIETVDKFGIIKTLSQDFVVFASGSQVAESATPSATPTITISLSPTQTPAPTVSLAPSISPTQTPTPILSPTPAVSFAPTLTPTNVPVVTPPPPGSSSSMILTVISVLMIFAGSALLFML